MVLQMTVGDYVKLVDAAKPDIVETLYESCAPFATMKQQAKAGKPDSRLIEVNLLLGK